MGADKAGRGGIHLTKRCPECFEYVPLHARECPACKTRLGEVQHHGIARRPTDWAAYLTAFLAAVAFGVYVWWAFF